MTTTRNHKKRADPSRTISRTAATARWRQLMALEPRTPDELTRFVAKAFGLHVPRHAVVAGHQSPMDYLLHSYFEPGDGAAADLLAPKKEEERAGGGGDCVVWANRGGGKTMLGAVATLLDMIFKPGIQIRILGGSLEQSGRMYRYLLKLLDRPLLQGLLAGRPTARRLKLINGSEVEILAQSQKSVRGVRVHKLRCDEVEEFDPAIWQAAQMVTQSATLNGRPVVGAVHALSTMHRPFGLMSRLVTGDRAGGPLLRWGALDVVQRCPPQRSCSQCPIQPDCLGRAKEADGFIPLDDLLTMHRRSSRETWQAEMLCLRPRRSDSVYPNFDPARHVTPAPPLTGLTQSPGQWLLLGGMDFGLRCPLVMLWALVRVERGQSPEQWPVCIIGEHVQPDLTLSQHLACLSERPWPKPTWIGVDPAGHQRNAQSGVSDVQILQKAGYRIRSIRQPVASGIERVRRRLDQNRLTIDPACQKLIESMTLYHFDPQNHQDDQPVKDGPDHACDALRYLLTNLECGSAPVQIRHW